MHRAHAIRSGVELPSSVGPQTQFAVEGTNAVASFLDAGSSDSLESFAFWQVEDFRSLANSLLGTPFVQLGPSPQRVA